MTSNNHQAFVKTYSRRGRTAGIQPSSPATEAQSQNPVSEQAGVEIGATPQITRIDPPQAISKVAPATPSSTDHERIAQQVGQQQRVTSLQHIHTAYAAPPVAPSTAAPVAPSTAAPDAPRTAQPDAAPTAPKSQPITERYDRQSQGPPMPHLRTQQDTVPVAPDSTVTVAPDSTTPVAPDSTTPAAPDSTTPEESKRPIQSFQAVWEVDVFDVPSSVADLFFDAKRYQQIAERMSDAVKNGLQSVLITSSQSGEGRSSVAVGIAMAAAASGIRVALVDADTEKPTLAEDLRLDLKYGWVDTIRGGLPIKEIAVHAVEDGVTLIPLMAPNGHTAATAFEVTRLVDTLKNHFDLLITDAPSTESSDTIKIASAFDSALVVRDVQRTDDRMIDEISNRLQAAGVQGVGVIDNFV